MTDDDPTTEPDATTEPHGPGRRAGLERTEVLDAALALVEAGGSEALSMRKLAAELGVATTTIYWHVGRREEVVLGLIERLSELQAATPVEGDTARERVFSVASHVWRSATAHRNVTALAHQVGATSLLELPLERALARELEAAGLRGPEVRDALRAILMCVAGFLVVGLRRTDEIPPEQRGEALWAAVDDPALSAETVAAMQEPPELPALFERTLRAVVASLVPPGPGEEHP